MGERWEGDGMEWSKERKKGGEVLRYESITPH